MHIRYWGDSYDIVKQSLIRWMSQFGEWAVHPMFTEAVEAQVAGQFADFLGARLLTDAVLSPTSARSAYLRCCDGAENVFLDPDTGLRLEGIKGKRSPEFLFAAELVTVARSRPGKLTMVFDQSHPRGATRTSLNRKLQQLRDVGLPGIAYESHACFVIVSDDAPLIAECHGRLLANSRLPAHRVVG